MKSTEKLLFSQVDQPSLVCPNLTVQATQQSTLCTQDCPCTPDPAPELWEALGKHTRAKFCVTALHLYHLPSDTPSTQPSSQEQRKFLSSASLQPVPLHLPHTLPRTQLALTVQASPFPPWAAAMGDAAFPAGANTTERAFLKCILPKIHPFKAGFSSASGLLTFSSAFHCQGSLPSPQHTVLSAWGAQLDSLSSSANSGICISFMFRIPIYGSSCQMLPAVFLHALI